MLKYKELDRIIKKISVTVCIAAIYNDNSILGVSDRMITAGDIEFEPPQSKILPISNSITVLTAGDSNVQTQLYSSVSAIISSRIASNPDKWIPVIDVANLYVKSYLELRMERAEKDVLLPYGLNLQSFVHNQNDLANEFIDNVRYELKRYCIENIATIIAGVDESGPHIFVIRNSELSCNDRIGFAAVGIGSNHAESHFMLSGYTRLASEQKALLTIHQAKKKSEVSPGVGKDTDMFVLGPSLGSFKSLDPIPGLDIVGDLDRFYKEYIGKVEKIDKNTEDKIKNYLDRLGKNSNEGKQEIKTKSEIDSEQKRLKGTNKRGNRKKTV